MPVADAESQELAAYAADVVSTVGALP